MGKYYFTEKEPPTHYRQRQGDTSILQISTRLL